MIADTLANGLLEKINVDGIEAFFPVVLVVLPGFRFVFAAFLGVLLVHFEEKFGCVHLEE